ncbi:MAG: hypothetical protein PF692_10650 [Kiritimatiellae bacterium]|jgi:hypothetical protein|nr:hypothetical protein [Kiritimatiellia bacterium]
MLPNLQSSLLCDDVRQEKNGKFMLIGLFDRIGLPKFPISVPRLFVVNKWCSGEGEFKQQSKIIRPDGKTALLTGKQIDVKLPNSVHTATSIEVFMNVTFQEEGVHWVEVSIEDELVIRYPLTVSKVNVPSAGSN